MSKLAPIHVLAKPTGAECNLDCKYCFFLSKDNLYPEEKSSRMTDELLEKYIRQLCEQAGEEVNVAWQGGEPTLMGLKFFQRSVELANIYRKPGQRILHTIQTNGVLLDDDWCAFFKANQFLVGLSVDGPRALHDTYRVDRSGNGSFDRVLRGWKLLRKHAVDVNILCTVHAANVEHPLEVYRFFRDEMQAEYLQFIPIVERATPELLPLANRGWGERTGAKRPLYVQQGTLVTERSVDAARFGQFLIAIYDEWVLLDVGKIFVQTFDVALGSWFGQHNLCIFSPECGLSIALEHNGDIYSCDHFVEPGYRLGSIVGADLAEVASSAQQQQFGYDKFAQLPQYCRECEVLFACYGECPRNRFITAPDGTPGLNYLCAGYKQFFKHVGPTMQMMKKLIQQRHYADEVMQLLKTNDYAAKKENAELARAGKEG